jgi:dGTPase
LDVLAREELALAPYAARSRASARPAAEEGPEPPARTAFQEDLYRIVHTRAFRRLAHKTQALGAASCDHCRTRLTHTLEVAQIARELARALGLNEDLSEAVSMGHDLGHAPFGHAGERVLNSLVPGGFTHQAQSLRIVDSLAWGGRGLNLTCQTRDGILKHSKGLGPIFAKGGDSPLTFEGQAVRAADIIAYLAHDMDDALEAGLLRGRDIPVSLLRVFGDSPESRENAMVRDLLESTRITAAGPRFAFSPGMDRSMASLRDFMLEKVYRCPAVAAEMAEGAETLRSIYLAITADAQLADELPLKHLSRTREEAARDFIAGMTDRFAIRFLERIKGRAARPPARGT